MTLLITESPAGRATTMTANQSANSLGTAVGGAVGGLFLATGGYRALGLGIPIFAAAAVLMPSWSFRLFAGQRASACTFRSAKPEHVAGVPFRATLILQSGNPR